MHINPTLILTLCSNAFIILLCITPDNFTRQGESADTQLVNFHSCIRILQWIFAILFLKASCFFTDSSCLLKFSSFTLRYNFKHIKIMMKKRWYYTRWFQRYLLWQLIFITLSCQLVLILDFLWRTKVLFNN